jgi:hypothetical protein
MNDYRLSFSQDAKIENRLLIDMYAEYKIKLMYCTVPVEDTKVSKLIKFATPSRNDWNQKSQCFLYPSSR